MRGKDFIPEMAVTCGGKKFYVDIGMPKYKIVVEVDGKNHKSKQSRYADNKRDKMFSSFNWLVIRLTHEEIDSDPVKSADKVLFETHFR